MSAVKLKPAKIARNIPSKKDFVHIVKAKQKNADKVISPSRNIAIAPEYSLTKAPVEASRSGAADVSVPYKKFMCVVSLQYSSLKCIKE